MSDKNVKLEMIDKERYMNSEIASIDRMYLKCIKPWLKPITESKIKRAAEQIEKCEKAANMQYTWLSVEWNELEKEWKELEEN